MSLTEHGLGVADGVRGVTFEHHAPVDAPDTTPEIAVLHEDGFIPRNSGRPDLYPHAPMHFRSGPQQPVTGRLDEALAPEPAPAPEEPAPAVQAAPPLGARLPAAAPASPAPPVSAPAAAE